MKKFLFTGMIVAFAFAFNLNQTYTCETLGISFKKNNKTYNVANTVKTQKQLKKSLKLFYNIHAEFKNKQLILQIGEQNDTLAYVKNVKGNVELYAEQKGRLFVLSDANVSQIGLSMPSQDLIIFYQCK